MTLQSSIFVVSVLLLIMNLNMPLDSVFTEGCGDYIDLTPEQITNVQRGYSLTVGHTGDLNFQTLFSCTTFLYTIIMIYKLQGTQKLGELIIMVNFMFIELRQFLFTFGLVIVAFVIVGRQLNREFKVHESSIYQIVLDIFDGINGRQDFHQYNEPQGMIFILVFVYVFKILLISFLVAMFINRYQYVWSNIDAIRRMDIIKLKNSKSYNEVYGGLTNTFFPISIPILPLILPMILFKSERMSDVVLKFQYTIMILMYCLIAVFLAVPFLPLLYMKCLANAIYICFNNKREDFRGQNSIQLFFTVVFNPPILMLSFLIDFLSLPNYMLQSDKNFEYKYQQSLETLTTDQTGVVLTTFVKIFYVNFVQLFGGKGRTLIELMEMHRIIFSLIDNLHDLVCRGNKDHKEALMKVQDYNMTKILTRKCSIPDETGDIKLAKCDFNTLFNIQMDIELYNYCTILFHHFRNNQLENIVEINKAKA